MRNGLVSAFCVLACFAAGQERPAREKPSDYAASAELARIWLAAEENAHSVTTPTGAYEAKDYLVIDVAVFSKDKSPVTLSAGNFTLRINGKTPTLPDSPGAVAASIKYDDWSNRPRLTAAAGLGDATIGTGYPRPQERFPGDPSGRSRLPAPPRIDTNNPNKPPPEQQEPIEQVVQRASLPEGQHVAPFGGLLYFPYKGKLAKIKKLELQYEGPYGTASLKLR